MTPHEVENLPILATAVELIVAIASGMAGNEVSSTVNGSEMNQGAIRVLATSTLNKAITEKTRHA